MASTYSTNLALELIGTGDQAGTWGNTTNTNLGTLIEQAISGYVTQAVSTGTDTTITIPNGATGVARNMFIELTGTGGASTNLIVPSNKKLYFIYNNASGAVTVKVAGQTGVSVAAGAKVILVSNGTDIVEATSYLTGIPSSLTVTTLDATNVEVTNVKAKDGTAAIVISDTSGNVGIGGTAGGNVKTQLLGSFPVLGGNTNTNGIAVAMEVPSAITSSAYVFRSLPSIAASTATTNVYQYGAANVTLGSGATLTNNYGFFADAMTSATNNYGFYSNIASGSNRWNFYANGTAANYFAGNVGIGTASISYRVTNNFDAPATWGNDAGNFIEMWQNSGTNALGVAMGDDSIASFTTNNGYNLVLATDGTERMRIATSTGNVGIKTTSPSTTLAVSGTISDVAGNVRDIPSAGTAKTSAYTLTVSDVGEFVTVGSGGSITVPNDTFTAGNAISIYNDTTGNISINCPITTAYLAGTNTDRASLTLATRGIATVLFINPSLCVATGNLT